MYLLFFFLRAFSICSEIKEIEHVNLDYERLSENYFLNLWSFLDESRPIFASQNNPSETNVVYLHFISSYRFTVHRRISERHCTSD